jgi:hypothetical protein
MTHTIEDIRRLLPEYFSISILSSGYQLGTFEQVTFVPFDDEVFNMLLVTRSQLEVVREALYAIAYRGDEPSSISRESLAKINEMKGGEL